MLEARFSIIKETEPEVLAHHFGLAGQYDRAVDYWTRAGQRAHARLALPEAVAHLRAGLEANSQLPSSVERNRTELKLRVLLGTACQSWLGWASTELIEALGPARQLALDLGDHERHLQVLDIFQAFHLNRAEFSKVVEINAQIEQLARIRGDSYAHVLALADDGLTKFVMGDFMGARDAFESVVKAYDPGAHQNLVRTHYNFDLKCLALTTAGGYLWALGYPDQAKQAAVAGLEWARQLGQPFNLSFFGLCVGSQALLLRREGECAQQWVAQADAIAREHALNFVAHETVPFWGGKALLEVGAYAQSYEQITQAQQAYEASGGRVELPDYCIARARALISMKRFTDAQGLLVEAINFIGHSGHKDEAEAYRVLGERWCEQSSRDQEAAERAYRKALDVARAQRARSFELRAATNLARLWLSQGKRKEALALLKPIYDWFTEGFDTKDLKQAKALLDDL